MQSSHLAGVDQRRYDMRHEMLIQSAPFCIGVMVKKGHAESAFRDACHTSSGGGYRISKRRGGPKEAMPPC